MTDFGGKSLGRMIDIMLVLAALGALSIVAGIVYLIVRLFT